MQSHGCSSPPEKEADDGEDEDGDVQELRRPARPCSRRHSCEQAFKLKLSGDEVYYTACSLLVVLKNSCSKLHCQKVLI